MIPKDPFMLLSYVNTQLRDFYPDLDQMCQALGLEKKELEDKLAGIDYSYDKTTNQFVSAAVKMRIQKTERMRLTGSLVFSFFYCQAYQ